MQLLIQRGQEAIAANKSNFTLWAKYELTEEERTLIQKYGIYNMLLVEGKPRELLKAVIWATFLTVITVFIFTWNAPDQIRVIVLILGILSYPLIIYLIYQQIRSLIKVSDLIVGRTFPCKSVVGLLVKEKEITEISLAFRHLLESLKNWRAKEIVKFDPYIAPAMPLLEKQP